MCRIQNFDLGHFHKRFLQRGFFFQLQGWRVAPECAQDFFGVFRRSKLPGNLAEEFEAGIFRPRENAFIELCEEVRNVSGTVVKRTNEFSTPAEREATAFGDPLETLWKNCVFGLCGVSSVMRCMYAPVAGSTAQQRASWLSEVTALVNHAAQSFDGADTQ